MRRPTARIPAGTIYFVQNGDIRSKVRQGGFPDAVKKLKALGVAAEILEGNVPEGKNDVQGAMLGVADFDWKASQSTILPGAICEHFTSFGGDMHAAAGQTPLSEWLRYGAAAASGTVTEPYAIPNKFPSPMMQVHYARGCTVAESFYQSVLCPYQLLIVGDPLCRPWANIPEITVAGVTADETVHDEIKVKPKARFAGGVEAEHFEMILDGLKIRECPPDGSLEVDTAMIADGAHELRVVAVSKGPVPARGEKIIPFTSANHDRTIQVTCEPEKVVSLKKSLIITAKSPKSTQHPASSAARACWAPSRATTARSRSRRRSLGRDRCGCKSSASAMGARIERLCPAAGYCRGRVNAVDARRLHATGPGGGASGAGGRRSPDRRRHRS